MRPTIPIADWRLAVDLDATRELLATLPAPECGRRCASCRTWAAGHPTALPAALAGALARLGLAVAAPADLYASGHADPAHGTLPMRVTYYLVGRILAGPPTFVEDARDGRVRRYSSVGSAPAPEVPHAPTLSVAYARDVGERVGGELADAGRVIQVDLRLDVPSTASHTAPGA